MNPETLVKIYRKIDSRRTKAAAVNAMRLLHLRHMAIRMDTINLCNLRCKMCYYSSDYMRKKQEMSEETFRKIADEVFPRTRFLYLSCATEPLTNKNFAKLLRIAGEYNVPFTSFCTNGQLLTREVVQAAIDANISEVIFSIDGATADTYEHIRRGGKWDTLLKKLELFDSVKAQSGAKNPLLRMNFTCMQRNINELPAMVNFAADNGAYSLHVRHLLTYTDKENSVSEEMEYVSVFNSIAAESRREAASRGISLFLPDAVPEGQPGVARKTCLTDGSQVSRRVEANSYCMLPWFQAIISWQGEYRVCTTQRLGNLNEQSFDQIYNGEKMREIRRRMLRRTEDSCSWNCCQEAYDVPEQTAESVN